MNMPETLDRPKLSLYNSTRKKQSYRNEITHGGDTT